MTPTKTMKVMAVTMKVVAAPLLELAKLPPSVETTPPECKFELKSHKHNLYQPNKKLKCQNLKLITFQKKYSTTNKHEKRVHTMIDKEQR